MPRKIPTVYNPEMLTSVIDRLDRLSSRLRAVKTWMEEERRAEMEITNHHSMVQGLQFMEAFGQAAERAVDNCRLGEAESATDD